MFPPPSFAQGPGMTSSPWLAAAPGPRECAEQLAVLRAQDRASKEQEQMRRTEEIARMQARIDYETRLGAATHIQVPHGFHEMLLASEETIKAELLPHLRELLASLPAKPSA